MPIPDIILTLLLSIFTLVLLGLALSFAYVLIARVLKSFEVIFVKLVSLLAKFAEVVLISLKRIASFLCVAFQHAKRCLNACYSFIKSFDFDNEAELAYAATEAPEPIPDATPHWATIDRRKKHDEIFARLWPSQKRSIKQHIPTEVLLLPAPKQLVIVEKTRKSTITATDVSDESLNHKVTDLMSHNSDEYLYEETEIDGGFEAAHERLMADSETISTFEIEKLDPDTVVNTTVPSKAKEKEKGKKVPFDKRKFPEFRDDVAKHLFRRWMDVFATYIDGDTSSTWARKRNTTCPECGRTKKFFVVNHDTGASHCAAVSCSFHCGDGFATIAAHTGDKYGTVVRKLAEDVGEVQVSSNTKLAPKKPFKKSPPQRTEMTKSEVRFLNMIMCKSKKLTNESLPYKYLISRGIPESAIQMAQNQLFGMDYLKYSDEDGNSGKYPALVVPISKGLEVIGYHRIYLDSNGNKLPYEEAKKPTGNYPGAYIGSSIKLGGNYMEDGVYRIAEGVETALAVIALEGKPCWSTMVAIGIQNFIPPENAKKVIVYIDLDASKTGEIVFKALHERLTKEGIECVGQLPNATYWDKQSNPKGIDFLNILNIKQKKTETC